MALHRQGMIRPGNNLEGYQSNVETNSMPDNTVSTADKIHSSRNWSRCHCCSGKPAQHDKDLQLKHQVNQPDEVTLNNATLKFAKDQTSILIAWYRMKDKVEKKLRKSSLKVTISREGRREVKRKANSLKRISSISSAQHKTRPKAVNHVTFSENTILAPISNHQLRHKHSSCTTTNKDAQKDDNKL